MMEKGDIQKRVKDTYCTGVCTSTPRLWSAFPKKVEEKKEEQLCLSEWADQSTITVAFMKCTRVEHLGKEKYAL